MARFKHYDYEQTKMISLRFADQIQLGTFEYTLNHVVDNELDLSVFESCYRKLSFSRIHVALPPAEK